MHNKPCVHVYTDAHGGSRGMSILSCVAQVPTLRLATLRNAVRLQRTSFSMNAQVVRCT